MRQVLYGEPSPSLQRVINPICSAPGVFVGALGLRALTIDICRMNRYETRSSLLLEAQYFELPENCRRGQRVRQQPQHLSDCGFYVPLYNIQ